MAGGPGGLSATAAEATDCVDCTFHAGWDGKNKHTRATCIHTTCIEQPRVHSKGLSIYRIDSWHGSNTHMRDWLSSHQLAHGDKTYGHFRKQPALFVSALDTPTSSQTGSQKVPTVMSQRPPGAPCHVLFCFVFFTEQPVRLC